MFFFLSKFLPLFIYPVGLTCVLIGVALLIWRRRRWQTAVLVTAGLILYLASTPLVSWRLTRTLEWRYLPLEPLPQAEVMVVLGGATEQWDFPQQIPGLNHAGDRLLYAAWLYHQGAAQTLLLTGGRLPGNTSYEAENMALILEMLGVPRAAMWLENEARNTYENGVYSKAMLDAAGVETIILVTSATHMPRSVAIFEKLGLTVLPAPTDYEVQAPDWDEQTKPDAQFYLLGVLPDAEALAQTTRVLKEYLGIFIYGLRGWV